MIKGERLMKNPWIAAIGNFFFSGLGTLYNGSAAAGRHRFDDCRCPAHLC